MSQRPRRPYISPSLSMWVSARVARAVSGLVKTLTTHYPGSASAGVGATNYAIPLPSVMS